MPLPNGVVSWRPMVIVYDTLRLGGVPDGAFTAPVLAAVERARSSRELVAWDDFITMQDQARLWCGTDERYLAVVANFEFTAPEYKSFADERVRAQVFCRFIFDAFDAAVFPEVRHEVREPEGCIELELWLPPHFCDSTSWMLGNVGALPTLTRHLGMPAMKMVRARFDGHHGLYRMRFPKEAELRRGEATSEMLALLELTRAMRVEVRKAVRDARNSGSASDRINHLARSWSLTARQEEVLGCVCEGMSNKQIAGQLACAVRTIEIHVSDILRKADLDSRAQLVACFVAPAGE